MSAPPDHPDYDLSRLPYRIAVLCYLFDPQGRLLMLHRRKLPNIDMHSPIGGKLEVGTGESPHECALREIREEARLDLPPDSVRLMGIVAEKAYQGEMHWLLFLFEVARPVRPEEIPTMDFEEGRLHWVAESEVETLNIPETDRRVMWPAVRRHRGGFFMIEIDCRVEPFTHRLVESRPPSGTPPQVPSRAPASPPRR